MQYSEQFKNIHSTQINHNILQMQTLLVYDYKSGIYQGEYYKNQRQGKGLFYWYSGQIYIGEWIKDTIQGQGTIYFPYGGNFVGFFLNNKVEGAGILTMPDGSRIAGNWKKGRITGNFVRYDGGQDEWYLINSNNYYNINKQTNNYNYAKGEFDKSSSYQKEIKAIYENIKYKIDTPYYRQMTERIEQQQQQQQYQQQQQINIDGIDSGFNPNFQDDLIRNNDNNQTIIKDHDHIQKTIIMDIDKYKIRLQQLDNDIFYHGIIRGTRPDGLGIIFSMSGRFSVRGKFTNTKLNGIGRVELDNGEIYDGIFRNGIICSGFYYNAKTNNYISGQFCREGNVSIDAKGKGYPYKLALENKTKTFPCMMIYKNTSEELIYLVQNDIKQLKMLDTTKYQFNQNDSQTSSASKPYISHNFDTQSKLDYDNDNDIDNNLHNNSSEIQNNYNYNDGDYEDKSNNINYLKANTNQSQSHLYQQYDNLINDYINPQKFNDDIQKQKISNNHKYSIVQDYLDQNQQNNYHLQNNDQQQQQQNKYEYLSNPYSSTQNDKQYMQQLLHHKINIEGIKQDSLDNLLLMNQLSDEIDQNNNIPPITFDRDKSKINSQALLQKKADYYLNKARYVKLKIKLKEEISNIPLENKDKFSKSYN